MSNLSNILLIGFFDLFRRKRTDKNPEEKQENDNKNDNKKKS